MDAVSVSDGEISERVALLAERLTAIGAVAATAESCTGGWIAKAFTDQTGSSAWFGLGVVSYSNQAKFMPLGVDPEALASHGAVSQEVAEQMVGGVLDLSGAELAVAVTGIAGPDGGTEEKPVGTVWLSWGRPGEPPVSSREQFAGNREAVRRQTVAAAIDGLLDLLAKESG